MKLVGLMLCKNEDWILGLSMRVALRWVDELIVVDTGSWDKSNQIISEVKVENPWRVYLSNWTKMKKIVTTSRYDHEYDGKTVKAGEEFTIEVPDNEYHWWDEMDVRQHSLMLARKRKATHIAIIDADEVLTANSLSFIRNDIQALNPGESLKYPMIPVWRDLEAHRTDDCVWTSAEISIAFADSPELTWKPTGDGYHHHHRLPYGVKKPEISGSVRRNHGGVMHLQFANWRRLVEKHVHYRMSEHLRWPDRETPNQLNAKYDQALNESGLKVSPCPTSWMDSYPVEKVTLNERSWYYYEIQKLLEKHGREAFTGLDLKGW